jgi:hypothetical protein
MIIYLGFEVEHILVASQDKDELHASFYYLLLKLTILVIVCGGHVMNKKAFIQIDSHVFIEKIKIKRKLNRIK